MAGLTLVAAALLSACRFVAASDDALYQCSRPSDCLVEGATCLDGYCRPPPDASAPVADGGRGPDAGPTLDAGHADAGAAPDTGTSPDASAPPDASCGEGCPVTRDVVVAVDWPPSDELDPLADPRAWSLRVVVSDSANPLVAAEPPASKSRGPFTAQGFTSSGFVDVSVEVRAMDTRLLGFGRLLHADVRTTAQVAVPVRRRLLYFTSPDRQTGTSDGQLRAFDLGSADVGEPGLGELSTPLPSTARPRALAMTADGRLLAQAGEDPAITPAAPALSIVATSDHSQQTLALPFLVSRLVALDGHTLLALPDGEAKTSVLGLVDLDLPEFTPVPLSYVGGTLDVRSAHRSPDGTKVLFVGTYTTTSARDVVGVYDVAGRSATELPVPAGLEGVGGGRWTPDGKVVLAAYEASADGWYTGSILVVDPAVPASPTKLLAGGGVSKLVDLFRGSGATLLANSETHYFGGTSSCCGGLHVFDLGLKSEVFVTQTSDEGPQFEIASAVRLPYPPFAVIGGQTDNGNNWHSTGGAFVDLSTVPPAKLQWTGGDIGSVEDAVTPFGEPL